MFRKLLIANRGEIAVRIAQTAQEMGIRVAAVFSEADRRSVHVPAADEAYLLEGTTAAETYLNGDKIIEIARQHDVDAIHPGYGFLAENANFAEACRQAGMTFVGPEAESIRVMGDKVTAKKMMADVGVSVVPGWSPAGDADVKIFEREAKRIGFPVLVKAAAGGGGKGMRVAKQASELASSVESARREAQAAFGDDRVFLEKFISRPRHVEVQVFGDAHGNRVHLFERDCSIQRRHQKIIEESPAPGLTPELREAMGEAAVRAADAVNYVNAGTVEFMLDDAGLYYFLEMNTRLQVEHPVTEAVTGYDLVRAQLQVAAGESLPFSQNDLCQTGHAVECRVYAEDADRGFMPSTGVIKHYESPSGPHIRVDAGVSAGSEVTVYYDPMLAKLIVWGRTRDAAIAKMLWALDRFVVTGVTTNIAFLRAVIDHKEFRRGQVHTGFLDEHDVAIGQADVPDAALIVAALLRQHGGGNTMTGMHSASADVAGPWHRGGAWRCA